MSEKVEEGDAVSVLLAGNVVATNDDGTIDVALNSTVLTLAPECVIRVAE